MCSDGFEGGLVGCDFPLVKANDISGIEDGIRNKIGRDFKDVVDIYPVTPLQEGLLSSMIADSSEYVVQTAFKLKNVDVDRYCNAWRMVLAHYDSFRTGFVSTSGGIYQVLFNQVSLDLRKIKVSQNGFELKNIEDILQADRKEGFTLANECFVRLSISDVIGKL